MSDESNTHMADKPLKRYIFASDFDQTLTFNDSGYVLSELVGIATEEFERKANGMAKINQVLEGGIHVHQFAFEVLSAAPVEVIYSALEGIVPRDHIYGTEFRYKPTGEIESIVRATAGYGKVAVLNQLLAEHVTGPDHVIYSGDGSSDIHVMLQLNARDGLT